jgi:hypothetical protein
MSLKSFFLMNNLQQCESISIGLGLRKYSSSHGKSFGVVINETHVVPGGTVVL